MIAVAGTMSDKHPYYAEHYYHHDPMQKAQKRQKPWILHGPRCAEWKDFLDHPVHTEFATFLDIDNYLSLRLNDFEIREPGQVGIILARTSRQPDFSDREQSILSNILPALETVTRRSARLEGTVKSQSYLESMLDFSLRPVIALDHRGGFMWASDRAEELISFRNKGVKKTPDELIKAARNLGILAGKKPGSTRPATSVAVPRKDADPIRADLRLARTRSGAYFVIAELEDPGVSPLLSEVGARYQLTGAETQVLRFIGLGLSNREISRRLFISTQTVYTHVTRILGKLGVSSRVQAALIAHGHRPEIHN
jgi:DNA-binding CsgD family transcriptional regulator